MNEIVRDEYRLINGDCVTAMRDMSDESVDLLITSIPFADKYTYSSSVADIGNAQDHDGEFWTHMDYAFAEIFRVMKPGRLAVWHIQDLRSYKGQHGFQGLRDVSGALTAALQRAGFWYQSKWMIRKDPPTQMRRTNAQHLLYCQLRRNALFSFPALPDYMIAMRKPGDPETPVRLTTEQSDVPTIACAKCGREITFADYESGDLCDCGAPLPDIAATTRPDDIVTLSDWQSWAESYWFDCVWSDVRMTDVLSNEKEGLDEKHICPMQLTAINRVIRMYSNPGETVFDPFAGIGSVGYEAVKSDRRFVGTELKTSYFSQAEKWLSVAANAKRQMVLL